MQRHEVGPEEQLAEGLDLLRRGLVDPHIRVVHQDGKSARERPLRDPATDLTVADESQGMPTQVAAYELAPSNCFEADVPR